MVPRSRRSAVEDGPDQLAVLGIEPDGRLVEDEEVGPVQRGAGDVDQPPPPAGELTRGLGGARRRGRPARWPRRPRRAQLASAQSREPRREAQVLLDGEEPVDAGLLKHEPQPAADGGRARATTSWPKIARRASGGGEQRGEQQHRGRLARAVGAEQADQRARRRPRGPARRGPGRRRSRARALRCRSPARRAHARCGSAAKSR